MTLLLLLLAAYALGSIPFGLLIARLRGVDILSVGSGNIGATNVGRALGGKWFAVVFILDTFKGIIPTLVARHFYLVPAHGLDPQLIWFIAGAGAVLGHCTSPFVGFKGGKGVSTSLGAIIGASPIAAALCLSVFVVLLLITGYVSLASIIAVPTSLIWTAVLPNQTLQLEPVYLVLSMFVIYRHRENIKRLRLGTESKFKFKKKVKSSKEE